MKEKSTIYRQGQRKANSPGKALQLGRRVTAIVALSVMMIFFVMLGTSAALKLKWITSVQIVPVILSVSGSLILFWILVTLLFGRVYCSMVCPTGIVQDLAARLPRRTRRLKLRRGYTYHAAHNKFRYIWLGIIVASVIAGMSLMLALFDPYSAFGRLMTYLLRPLISVANGGTMLGGTLIGIVTAAATLAAIVAVPIKRGRLICNTVCPVGSILSLVSRHSVYGIDINTDTCVNCGLCARVCKAECIDTKDHTVDMSRCVVCFDCTAVCDSGAITYTTRKHRLSIPMLMKVTGPRTATTMSAPGNASDANASLAKQAPDHVNDAPRLIDRRQFLATGLILMAAPVVLSAEKALDRITPGNKRRKQLPTTDVRPVPPPGIESTHSFLTKCVGCGACISVCPTHVLSSSSGQYGMAHPLHPVKNYDESFCLYDCVKCTEVCPTGALDRLTVEEKHLFRVGLATVDTEACIGCGLCARNCPRDTITMVREGKRRVAKIDLDGCIGCGECQYVCPAQPAKAIKVNGLQR